MPVTGQVVHVLIPESARATPLGNRVSADAAKFSGVMPEGGGPDSSGRCPHKERKRRAHRETLRPSHLGHWDTETGQTDRSSPNQHG